MKKNMKWLRGSMVALVTPFTRNNKLDAATLKKLVDFHIKQGTSVIVPSGTTGESATLTHDEHMELTEIIVKAARGRIPVLAGAGSNNTQEALELTQHAKDAGADGVLLIAPYYNKPTQAGLIEHYLTLADAVDIPQVPYNIASRTGVNMLPESFAKLAKHKNIVAVKEASGSLEQMASVLAATDGKLALLSGDDTLTLPVLSIGGTGVISVVANIVPKPVAQMIQAFEKGNLKLARKLHYQLLPLVQSMFIETNPIPVKTAMQMLKLIPDARMRLPMCKMGAANAKQLKQALKAYGLKVPR